MARGRFGHFHRISSMIDHPMVMPEPNSGCWIWMGCRTGTGHGLTRYRGGWKVAHQVALLLTGIEIPEGKIICHKCNLRPCVNPDHLYVGTYKTNMADAKRAGTLDKRFDGEKHWNHKLTEIQVKAILDLPPNTNRSLIAEQYGVSRYCISDIINHRSWGHLHA